MIDARFMASSDLWTDIDVALSEILSTNIVYCQPLAAI